MNRGTLRRGLRRWLDGMGVAALLWCGIARANVVLDWNAVMMSAIRLDNTGPTLSTRNLALLHTAIYDAVNSVDRGHQPYRVLLDAPAEVSVEAAAAGAGYEVLKLLYPTVRARSDSVFEEWRAGMPDTPATTNGLALGKAVAAAMLDLRAGDGANTDVPYIPSDAPGQWRRTPPFFRPPLTPQWRYVTPFALPQIEPYVPGPPPALGSPAYAESFNEVKALGSKQSSVRTPVQGQIAVFWSDFSYTAMPPGHWHEIAATIVRSQGTGLVDTARLMALLGIAQADAAIVCWETKFRYNLWRPVTAIARASEDNNPQTEADPSWEQLLGAPPFPAYTSGHSTFSKASAEVLTAFYGTDQIPFTAASDALPGVFRDFTSLAACADEIGMSRIYGGIHFQFDNVAGKASGRKVAAFVTANCLLPISALPLLRYEVRENGVPAVRVHAEAGHECAVEASNDLVHWERVGTVRGSFAGTVLEDPSAPTSAARFYRIRQD